MSILCQARHGIILHMKKIAYLTALAIVLAAVFGIASVAHAADASLRTDKAEYKKGDYVKVLISLPNQKFGECKTSFISPSGAKIADGTSGCVAGSNSAFDARFDKEPRITYVPEGQLVSFATYIKENGIQYSRLGEQYGTWKFVVDVYNEDGTLWKSLSTSFNYGNYESVDSNCVLKGEVTKTCTFLANQFVITKGAGCGPSPVAISVSYYGGKYSFDLKQGEKGTMPDTQSGYAITVRNNGAPCGEDILNIKLDRELIKEAPEPVAVSSKTPAKLSDKQPSAVSAGKSIGSGTGNYIMDAPNEPIVSKSNSADAQADAAVTAPKSKRLFGIFRFDNARTNWWTVFAW